MKPLRILSLLLLLSTLPARAADVLPPLVDVPWLLSQGDAPALVLIDIQPLPYYRQVHLAGAVSAPFERWRAAAAGVRGLLPPIAHLEALLGGLGVTPEDRLVIVTTGLDAGDMAAAARVYWTLKVLGHRQVAILNGGLNAVAADPGAARELTADDTPPRGLQTYRARPDLALLADAEATRAAARRGELLIDARTAGEFLGIHVGATGERPGTLPGARNLPFEWLTENGSGVVLPTARLRALLGAVGIDPAAPQVHFCHSGNRAALTWFAAYALLGNRQARLYDASMLEWATRADLPMERQVQF